MHNNFPILLKIEDMGKEVLIRYSLEEYLTIENKAKVRHEYHNGILTAISAGTLSQGKLGCEINTELNLLCRSMPCIPFNGDVRIRIKQANRFVYPEASVVCGKVESSQDDPNSIINPVLIAEVLSDTSEAYDRGAKFRLYQQLPSFKEYILIDQHRPVVSLFYKKDETIWEMREIMGLDKSFYLNSLQGEIKMSDLYQNVEDLKDPLAE